MSSRPAWPLIAWRSARCRRRPAARRATGTSAARHLCRASPQDELELSGRRNSATSTWRSSPTRTTACGCAGPTSPWSTVGATCRACKRSDEMLLAPAPDRSFFLGGVGYDPFRTKKTADPIAGDPLRWGAVSGRGARDLLVQHPGQDGTFELQEFRRHRCRTASGSSSSASSTASSCGNDRPRRPGRVGRMPLAAPAVPRSASPPRGLAVTGRARARMPASSRSAPAASPAPTIRRLVDRGRAVEPARCPGVPRGRPVAACPT